MTVTDISKPKKHLVSVYFDSGESVLLDSDFIKENGIAIGSVFDDDSLYDAVRKSEKKRAFSRACYYLADSDYSEKGMCDKLKKAGFDDDSATFAVKKLTDLGYINDNALAERLAERFSETIISRREAMYKMNLKGIDRHTAEDAIEKFIFDEKTKICELIEKKYVNRLSSEDDRRKVFAALMRKGFSAEDIRSAMRQFRLGDDLEEN